MFYGVLLLTSLSKAKNIYNEFLEILNYKKNNEWYDTKRQNGHLILSVSCLALFAPKKKMCVRPRFSPDASLRGALSWSIVVEDCSTNQQLEAFIAISSDTIVIIRDNTHRDLLFITACRSVEATRPVDH